MPGISRAGTPEPFPSPSKRQRTFASDSSIFPCPPIPTECIASYSIPPPEQAGLLRNLQSMTLVPRTQSSEWGKDEAAAARALIEPTTTLANQQLVRTHHPSLSGIDGVYAVQESEDKWIWIVAPGPNPTAIATHAGGRQIHVLPVGITELTTTMWPHYQSDPRAALNPRRFLSPEDLHILREKFPSAVGVRVFVSGYVVILFKSRANIEKSWKEDGFAREYGNLRLCYDVLKAEPTQKELFRGAAVASQPESLQRNAALGLKIRLADGQIAITVPTHAFINTSPMLRIADWYARIKRKLARFAPIKKGSSEPAVGTTGISQRVIRR